MSDTTQCLEVPMADYTNGRQLALAPCAAVPEQNFSLPVAGQTLHINISAVAVYKSVDLNNFNTTSGARVVVSSKKRQSPR
jgi:hypothetical protein